MAVGRDQRRGRSDPACAHLRLFRAGDNWGLLRAATRAEEEAARKTEEGVKAKMREYSSVSIPREAVIAALRMGDEG
jgi:hypothetical protein